MNWESIEGRWHEFKGQIRSRWNKLTDEDIGQLAVKRDVLVGRIQHRYGIMKDEAERQVDEWMRKIDGHAPGHQQPPTRRP
jgi:uncharacterized protein YjbJ (UPF0337 family)